MKKIKNIITTSFLSMLLILFLFSCNKVNNDNPITVFAATGAMYALDELSDSFYSDYSISIDKNYAASGNLARQIYSGAKSDIYISASLEWINHLKNNNELIDSTIHKLAKNKLVIICPKNRNVHIDFSSEFNIESIIPDKIAIGDPAYVPAGKYAKEIFDTLNWYTKIKNRIILAKDVSSVLHYVELGECDWGIVYYTEAIKSKNISIVCEIPDYLYEDIYFYLALMNDSNMYSKVFYSFLLGDKAKVILNKHGFITDF